VIGGRHREDYAGLEVAGTAPGAAIIGDATKELVLPVSYVFATRSFRLKGYSVMVGERPGLRAGGVWNQTCIACHNTLPQFENYWSAAHGPGAPPHQSVLVDRLLPAERQLPVAITDADRMGAGAARRDSFSWAGGRRGRRDARAAGPGGANQPRPVAGPAPDRDRGRLRGLPRRQPGARRTCGPPAQLPAAQRFPGGGTDHRGPNRAEWINRTCARCHQVLFTRYAYTWEGGLRQVTPGGSHINSGEGRDFCWAAAPGR
jgi:hypothetical protein